MLFIEGGELEEATARQGIECRGARGELPSIESGSHGEKYLVPSQRNENAPQIIYQSREHKGLTHLSLFTR
jgi:hypothetical protein